MEQALQKNEWVDLSIKYCLACRVYLCDHHILINEKDEHIYDYNFKLTEKMHIFRKIFGSRSLQNFLWSDGCCPHDHSLTFSPDELVGIARNKSLMKWLNLFHLAKVTDKCQIGFYTGKHCGIIGQLMRAYHQDFARHLFLFRYKNFSNSVFKEYPRTKLGEGLAQIQRRIFDPKRPLARLKAETSPNTQESMTSTAPGEPTRDA